MTKSKKLDIVVDMNVIAGRQGWAYICNSGKFPVLRADLDKPQEYEDFRKYGDVRVARTYRGAEMFTTATLEYFEGKYKLGSAGCFISNRFGYSEAMELIDNANLPVVREGQVVAIALYGKKHGATLWLYKVGKVDTQCQTVAVFEPLTEEESVEIMEDAVKWVLR